jgi:hypothetical protein
MPMTNFTDLQALVTSYVNNTTATASDITDFIRLTEARMVGDFAENQLLSKLLEVETIVTGVNPSALSPNYRGTSVIYLDTNPKRTLNYQPPSEFFNRYSASTVGVPIVYTIQGMNISFGPSADDTYNAEHWYVKMPDLATDGTNSILTNHPNLYLYGVLSEAYDFLGNELKQSKYEKRYMQIMDNLEDEGRSFGTLQVMLAEAGAGAPYSRRGYR